MRPLKQAGVMELVDVPDSKSGVRENVGVRVPPPAPNSIKVCLGCQRDGMLRRYQHHWHDRVRNVINLYELES